jgi:hypothetical protein
MKFWSEFCGTSKFKRGTSINYVTFLGGGRVKKMFKIYEFVRFCVTRGEEGLKSPKISLTR